MRRIAGVIRLVRFERVRVCGLEERKRRWGIAGRTQPAAALELEAYVRNRIVPCELLGFGKQASAGIEFVTKGFDASELRLHLRATGVGLLATELLTEANLGRIEVFEIPERPQPIRHRRAG